MDNMQYSSCYHASWALLIGINDYKKASPLSYACNDADALQAALKAKLGFPKQQIVVLKNEDATKARILDEYINLHAKASNRDDRVLFFFAGHGTTYNGNNGPIGYLVPVDGDPNSLSSLLRWDDITRNAELIPAKHILFIMDACYSGLAIRRTLAPGVKRFVSDLLQRPARQVITAGKADQTVADGGGASGKNSIFTGYLIEGINGAASNQEGVLTANSLMSYLQNKIGQDPRSQQTPHFGHIEGDGDFVLLTPGQEHLSHHLSSDYLIESALQADEVEVISTPQSGNKSSFASQCGYGEKGRPNFGRNDLSAKLGEYRVGESGRECERAFSWLGVLIEPTANQEVSIDIAKKAAQPSIIHSVSDEPHERFSFPQNLRTTSDSLLLHSDLHDSPYWGRYLKIERSGKVEYADTQNVFFEYKGFRIFKLTQLIGLSWQVLFLAKNLLMECGYHSGIRLTVCLVGTRDTILANFSQEAGKDKNRWRDPLIDPFGLSHIADRVKCTDANMIFRHDLIVSRISYEESVKVMKSIAQNIELAYNHQDSPRSFNFDTDVFPWNTYSSDQRF